MLRQHKLSIKKEVKKTIKYPVAEERGVNFWNIIKIIEPKKQPKKNPFFDESAKKHFAKIKLRKIEDKKAAKKFIVGKNEIA